MQMARFFPFLRNVICLAALFTFDSHAWGKPILPPPDLNPNSLEKLETRLNAARLERMHWERVIAVQADLAQHPDKFSSASREAAGELQSQGRAFTVEGITMGLSSAFELRAAFLDPKQWREKKKLIDVATAISATHKILLEDQLRGAKEPENPDAGLEKAGAALKLMARTASTKEERETAGALVEIGTPTLELLGRLMRGERLTWEKDGPLMKDVVQGTRAMMLAFIQHRNPDELIGLGKRLAKSFPRTGALVEAVGPELMTKGLGAAGVLNGTVQAIVGGYVWTEGIDLANLADDIRDDQQHAAVKLQALLPHARQARDSALRREKRLERLVEALKKQNPPVPNRFVSPSARILDDGAGIPANVYAGLNSTQAVLQSSPQMTYHLTKNEIRRREAIAAAERAAALARERAARQAAERARREREREEERQSAARESSRGSNSGGWERPSGRVDLSGVNQRIQGVVNNVLPNW
jgi:hypothetical protein